MVADCVPIVAALLDFTSEACSLSLEVRLRLGVQRWASLVSGLSAGSLGQLALAVVLAVAATACLPVLLLSKMFIHCSHSSQQSW